MTDTCSTTTLEIRVNGEVQELPAPATLATLIELRQPRPPFAIELNKTLVRRGEFATTTLKGGDTVEIVTLVGGG